MPQLKRPQRIQRNRRGRSRDNPPLALSLSPSIIDFTTPNVTLTFPVNVVLNGIPRVLTDTGKYPTSATKTAPNVVRLGYDVPGAVTTVNFLEKEPAIRSSTGGYLIPGTFPAA